LSSPFPTRRVGISNAAISLTTDWLLNAHTPLEERAVWQMKLRAYRLYHQSHDPEGLAKRLLAIVLRDRHHQQAA
jgi:hypothetical protein